MSLEHNIKEVISIHTHYQHFTKVGIDKNGTALIRYEWRKILPRIKICETCEKEFDTNNAEFYHMMTLLCNDCYRSGVRPKYWPRHWKWDNYHTRRIKDGVIN